MSCKRQTLDEVGCIVKDIGQSGVSGYAEVATATYNAYGSSACLVTSFQQDFTGIADTEKVLIDRIIQSG
ncbi:hypothetical protein GCM10009000_081730 [Halobacterium noricense]|uniref:Uncharacterized protein n=1 Tax=Haladaptatus pallidirubidus TaxID=1008152 RepID=A0AAV3UPZ1_9EURY